jgi:amino acid transporter
MLNPNLRLLPSFGLLLVSLQSSSVYSLLQRTAGTAPHMCGPALNLSLAGLLAGLFVLVCCKQHMAHLLQAWLSRKCFQYNTYHIHRFSHSSSMCEEVRQPATQVPKALVATILLNTTAGFIFLIPLVYVLPDISELINYAQPVPAIFASAIGNQGGAFALTIPLLVLGLICGIGCTTATSRCAWAFSRDGAIPGSRWWKQVNTRLGLPFNAMMLTMVVEILLGCIYFGSTAAYNAFSGVGVIFLTVSYAIPILASLLGGRKHIKGAPFDRGVFGLICNVVALGEFFSFSPHKPNS